MNYERYQDAITEATSKMGHGMAKFICKEVRFLLSTSDRHDLFSMMMPVLFDSVYIEVI